MRLAQLCEWETGRPPEAARRLPTDPADLLQVLAREQLDPASIIDRNLCQASFPFIFSGTTGLLVGPADGYHSDITERLPPALARQAARICAEELPGAIGRVGRGLVHLRVQTPQGRVRLDVEGGAKLEIVSYYDSSDAAAVPVSAAHLLERGLISQQAVLLYAQQATFARDQASFAAASTEQQERARLQIALHLGAWPDGRRLTPQEKLDLQEKLGLRDGPMRRPGWSQGPGQKWWAPTSESTRRIGR